MRLIRLFVNNPVAANMLMLVILGGGLAACFVIPREMFPEFEQDRITISVPYPGAAPEDIERGICLKIEDQLGELEGVDEIRSTSTEGMGSVRLDLATSVDPRKVLDDVKSEVDKIDFPENAEDPVVQLATRKIHVIMVAVYGQASRRTLKEIAEDVKDDITALPEVSQVTISGVPDYEISVEIDEEGLRRYGLTMETLAQRIRESSFDLPAGRIKTRGGEYALRIVGQKYTAGEYGNIPILYQPDGTVICLRDVANVREAFEDVDMGGQFNGQPSVLVQVFKTGDEDVLDISKAVHEYIQRKQAELPEGIHLGVWSDLAKLVDDRLEMLIRNGIQGLILVALVLWLFLGLRLSFWVALGIPVSILGTMMVMYLTGTTLNMMSMFALIMALGLIVDDAIVVGENVYSSFQRGEGPHLAATDGSAQVILPVLGAVITTWLAFAPLLFIPGTMGKFISQLPGIVILTLAFSLLECTTILPSHLAHSLERQRAWDERGFAGIFGGVRHGIRRLRERIDAAIQWLIYHAFLWLYQKATKYRYVTLTFFAGIMLMMIGAFRLGYIRTTVFPKSEGDTLVANITMPTGTNLDRTETVAEQITKGAFALNQTVETPTGEPLVQNVYALLGAQMGRRGGGDLSGGHVATVMVELLPSEKRGKKHTTDELTQMWRQASGAVPDALQLTFGQFHGGPGGGALEFRVHAPTIEQARDVAGRLKKVLAKYQGVFDIEDDALPGKMELKIQPRREAYASGINQQVLARQLRDAFYGNESIKMQRGRDEVKVMVRYPESHRRSLGDIEAKRIRTPDGKEVPFAEVADVTMQRGYTALTRIDGKSVVTVSADIDENRTNAEQILNDLANSGELDRLTASVDQTRIEPRGQRQQLTESLGALYVWFPLALLGIFTVLAVIFRSYIQPIIVMIAIPFGLIGAVLGHWVMGFDLTLLSLFGMVALAGIVVNDSLVLIDRVNNEIRGGAGMYEATRRGACGRFRAIFLTTITTVAGMTPLLMEKSFQAQFLKPMAVSISFGLSFATMLTLLVVPCLLLAGNDLRRVVRWLFTGHWPSPEDVVQHAKTVQEERKEWNEEHSTEDEIPPDQRI
ncbi:MAG: efflux RND transporter permease subunit [Phycisphaerae bacterium]|nr:efflux RND transporter permease subunit [Phycisphaerae bacterium]